MTGVTVLEIITDALAEGADPDGDIKASHDILASNGWASKGLSETRFDRQDDPGHPCRCIGPKEVGCVRYVLFRGKTAQSGFAFQCR
jgi:hypothetical protein